MTEPTSAQDLFKGRHFDQEIIILCVRWYITFKLSFRDLVQYTIEKVMGRRWREHWCSEKKAIAFSVWLLYIGMIDRMKV